MDIRSYRQKGLRYVELGLKYHMDPLTAKRNAEPKTIKMDPYKQIVDQWLEEAPYMKIRKTILFAAIFLAAISFTACGTQPAKTDTKDTKPADTAQEETTQEAECISDCHQCALRFGLKHDIP